MNQLTDTEQRIARLTKTMKRSLAKLAETDPAVWKRISDEAMRVADDIRKGAL